MHRLDRPNGKIHPRQYVKINHCGCHLDVLDRSAFKDFFMSRKIPYNHLISHSKHPSIVPKQKPREILLASPYKGFYQSDYQISYTYLDCETLSPLPKAFLFTVTQSLSNCSHFSAFVSAIHLKLSRA